MEFFLAQRVEERVVLYLDRLRGTVTAIEHARHLAGVAQAAARTRALRVSFACYDFHFCLQLYAADRDQSLLRVAVQHLLHRPRR